jgi:hypothetical protein
MMHVMRMLRMVVAVMSQTLETDGPTVDVFDLPYPEFAITTAITPYSVANVPGRVVVFERKTVSNPLLVGQEIRNRHSRTSKRRELMRRGL